MVLSQSKASALQCWRSRVDYSVTVCLLCWHMQIGMFCYTGMTPEMVDQLANLSIYLTR